MLTTSIRSNSRMCHRHISVPNLPLQLEALDEGLFAEWFNISSQSSIDEALAHHSDPDLPPCIFLVVASTTRSLIHLLQKVCMMLTMLMYHVIFLNGAIAYLLSYHLKV